MISCSEALGTRGLPTSRFLVAHGAMHCNIAHSAVQFSGGVDGEDYAKTAPIDFTHTTRRRVCDASSAAPEARVRPACTDNEPLWNSPVPQRTPLPLIPMALRSTGAACCRARRAMGSPRQASVIADQSRCKLYLIPGILPVSAGRSDDRPADWPPVNPVQADAEPLGVLASR